MKKPSPKRRKRKASRPNQQRTAKTPPPPESAEPPLIVADNVSVFVGGARLVRDISFEVHRSNVTSLIGSSGCGKTTLLRTICRSIEDEAGPVRIEGMIRYRGQSIFDIEDVGELRRQLCYVAQLPNTFRTNIYENLAIPARYWFPNESKARLDERVERALKRAGLWDSTKNRLTEQAHALSAGERQKLCLARALMVEPEVLLLDEPTANLDPISTAKFEEVIHELRGRYGILIITHNMQQAARVSQRCQYMLMGKLVEQGETTVVFTNPSAESTRDYITGRWG